MLQRLKRTTGEGPLSWPGFFIEQERKRWQSKGEQRRKSQTIASNSSVKCTRCQRGRRPVRLELEMKQKANSRDTELFLRFSVLHTSPGLQFHRTAKHPQQLKLCKKLSFHL